jgi:hypothetical protein
MARSRCLVTLILSLAAVSVAWGERPIEPPASAAHVVTGEVRKVFHRDGGSVDEYVVQIRIDGIEKGKGYDPGDTIYAFAFRRKPGLGELPSASGHTAVPKEGQRIRAQIKRGKGQMEALYPDWFNVLTPDRRNLP